MCMLMRLCAIIFHLNCRYDCFSDVHEQSCNIVHAQPDNSLRKKVVHLKSSCGDTAFYFSTSSTLTDLIVFLHLTVLNSRRVLPRSLFRDMELINHLVLKSQGSILFSCAMYHLDRAIKLGAIVTGGAHAHAARLL